VDREYAIIHALEKTDVPVPKAYALCEDESILGTPFYIMSFLDGRFIKNAAIPDVSEDDRREMWRDAVRTLAKLHRIHPKDVGLEGFGRPNGFYKRQIKTFKSLAQSQAEAKDKDTGEAVGQLPYFEELIDFFGQEKIQPHDRGVLFHGDYKIDNLVFHKTEPRVIGILDWEMATIGHPLADLTNLLSGWTISNATPSWPRKHADEAFLDPGHPQSTKKDFPGLPTHAQCVEWYRTDSGFAVSPQDLAWATAFALFRDSIIFQGIAARYAARQASSASAKEYGEERVPFARMARDKVHEATARLDTPSKL
jgi:aminoglycoside phosphotransferase (APT) family kinase protein